MTGEPDSANPAGGGPLAISKRHRWTRHRGTPEVGDPAREVLAE